jgi:uncharacterized membrane protein YbjE (DUF340 family)
LGVAVLFGAHILGDLIAQEAGGSGSVLSAFRICVGHGWYSLSHWGAMLKKGGAEAHISIYRRDWPEKIFQ